jgi:hypothetical protein
MFTLGGYISRHRERAAMNDTPQTISSPQTFFVKFFLPVFWIAGFGAGVAATWSGLLVSKHGQPAPEAVKYAFAFIWVVGTLLISWQVGRLRRVRIDGGDLLVSDYRTEEAIPLNQVAAVGPDNSRSNKQVVITLRSPCGLGEKIRFIPCRNWAFWSVHPVVAELRRRARLPA